MLVRDLMRIQSRVCSPGHSLTTAGRIMLESGCTTLPVVSGDLALVGTLSASGICAAVVIRDRAPSKLEVREVLHQEVVAVRLEDSPVRALELMRLHRRRELPVVDGDDSLRGIVFLDDLIVGCVEGVEGMPPLSDVVMALRACRETAIPVANVGVGAQWDRPV